MNYILKYITLAFFLFTASCAFDVPEDAFDYLVPPVIVSLEQKAGDTEHIYINFRGYNKEYYFQGYNVYVSDKPLLRTHIYEYKAVEVDEPDCASAVPSYPLSPDDYNPALLRTIKVRQYWCSDNSALPCTFVNGTTYYVLMCSYHQLLHVTVDAASNDNLSITFVK
ncbi:MAG: hypothetical protein V1874_16400 [Spirochaetota bacterium]